MLKEEHKVAVLRVTYSLAPTVTTMINIRCKMSVPNYIIWSLCNTIFMNLCCLGFVASTYSMKFKDQKVVGDVAGAQAYACTTKCLNIWALVLGLLLIIAFIIISATGSLIIF
nr:putative dispanin subfamily A member 2d [Mirounga angustirostris]